MRDTASTSPVPKASGPQRLLLLGGGHAQLAVLRMLVERRAWLAEQCPRLEIVLVTPWRRQVYSGMLPGWLAGHYRTEQCVIPLEPWAAAAGVQVRWSAAVRLSAAQRQVELATGEVLDYDWLSLSTGPAQSLALWRDPQTAAMGVAAQAAPALRPIEDWLARTQARLAALERLPRQVVVVGGGAAGFELALAWQHRLQHDLPSALRASAQVSVVTGHSGLLANYPARVRRLGAAALAQRGVRCLPVAVQHIDPSGVLCADGAWLPADETVLATGTQAPDWLRGSGLHLAPDGGVATTAQLTSVSHPEVLAAGDVASRVPEALPKSGVYAVRAGPLLAANVLARLTGQALHTWHAPRRTLNLLSLGEQAAIAAWGPWAVQGAWVWRWKDRIDRGFMARFGAVKKNET